MSPATLDVFTETYFSPQSVSLGRLVLNKKAPNEDFLVLPATANLKPSDIEACSFDDVQITSRNDSGCKIDFALTKLVTFNHENSSAPPPGEKPTDDLTTSKIVVYKILNSGNIFDAITRDDPSKIWIEKHMKRSTIYMISGIQTVFDAKVEKSGDGKSQTGGGIQILLSQFIPGGTFPGQELLDLKFSGKVWDNQHTLVTFMSPGERIVGIQYRRLGFRLFYSKNLREAALKEGKWWMRLTSDGKSRGEEVDVKDAVEIFLEDFSKEDIDRENKEEEEDDDGTSTWRTEETEKKDVVAIF
jgi:hypothetical protein